MKNIVVKVPRVAYGYEWKMRKAIEDIAFFNVTSIYDSTCCYPEAAVKLLVDNITAQKVADRFNCDVREVKEFILEWYDEESETHYKERHVDGEVYRSNCGIGEGCFWTDMQYVRSESKEEFNGVLESAAQLQHKIAYWD